MSDGMADWEVISKQTDRSRSFSLRALYLNRGAPVAKILSPERARANCRSRHNRGRTPIYPRFGSGRAAATVERLRHDPAMRWIVGGKAAHGRAASPSQMGRFETQWLATETNLSALTDLSGQWIDQVHSRRPPRGIVLDMDSSVSPTHGEQEMSVCHLLSPAVRIQPVR